jgi:hypothetical protein
VSMCPCVYVCMCLGQHLDGADAGLGVDEVSEDHQVADEAGEEHVEPDDLGVPPGGELLL